VMWSKCRFLLFIWRGWSPKKILLNNNNNNNNKSTLKMTIFWDVALCSTAEPSHLHTRHHEKLKSHLYLLWYAVINFGI
jgi:hypothetical protein